MCRNLISKDQLKQADKEKPSKQVFNEKNSCLANVSSSTKLFLPILKIRIRGPKEIMDIRAVIDTGSQRSYVSQKIAKNLGYETIGEQTIIHLLFGGAKTKPQRHKACRIYIGNVHGTYACDFIALQQETICQNIPSTSNGP